MLWFWIAFAVLVVGVIGTLILTGDLRITFSVEEKRDDR